MDVVHPWLDPAEVRRMAERLLAPVQEQAVPVQDAGFGEQFVGYDQISVSAPVAVATTPAAVAAPAHVEAPALVGRLVPEPVAAVESAPPVQAVIEPQSAVRGPFLDRITRFRDWLRYHYQAVGVFLMDRDGAVIFDESGHGKLHYLARSLAVSSRRPGGMPGNVHVKVGASATLEVIPADTPYGCLILGAVVPAPLDPSAIQMIMDALCTVATPQQ